MTFFPVVWVTLLGARSEGGVLFPFFVEDFLDFRNVGIGIHLHTQVIRVPSFHTAILCQAQFFFGEEVEVLYSFFFQGTESLSEFDVQFLVVLFLFDGSTHVADRIMFYKQNRGLSLFTNLAYSVEGAFVNLRVAVASHVWHVVEDIQLGIDFGYQVEDFRFHLTIAREAEIHDRVFQLASDDVAESHTRTGSTSTLRNGSTV